jgi:hypothetical protein
MNIKDVQREQLAFKTKLTAVTVYISPSRKFTRFVMLHHDRDGKARLYPNLQAELLDGVRRGTTYTVG